jgi:hypothetical protein
LQEKLRIVQEALAEGASVVARANGVNANLVKKGVKDEASDKAREAKEQARQQWDHAMQQIHTPGRMDRMVRWGQRLLPVRPQYIPAGTVYFAELRAPLEFGSEAMTQEMAQSIGSRCDGAGAFVDATELGDDAAR